MYRLDARCVVIHLISLHFTHPPVIGSVNSLCAAHILQHIKQIQLDTKCSTDTVVL